MDQLKVRIGAISPDPDVLNVILSGSRAERCAVPGSDVDILIVPANLFHYRKIEIIRLPA